MATEGEEKPLQSINELLDYLGDFTQTQEEHMIFRTVEPDEMVNDALDEIEPPVEVNPLLDAHESSPFKDFKGAKFVDMAAVDSGIIRLGETENGLFIALRGAIVIDSSNQSEVHLFRTGSIFLPYEHKAELLYFVGQSLLKPDLFVKIDDSDPMKPILRDVKRGAADNANQYGDRFRNYFERMLQLMALTKIQNGILLLDGALTLGTRDTPRRFLHDLSQKAADNGNALVAISKKSSLQVQNKTIPFWLNDNPYEPGYKRLTQFILQEQQERVLGNLYAVRFTPAGPTFRMDVKATAGQSDEEAINALYSNCLMRAGYPDILARAHASSYFTASAVVLLQANIRAYHRVIPRLEVNLTPILAPFGGRYR